MIIFQTDQYAVPTPETDPPHTHTLFLQSFPLVRKTHKRTTLDFTAHHLCDPRGQTVNWQTGERRERRNGDGRQKLNEGRKGGGSSDG